MVTAQAHINNSSRGSFSLSLTSSKCNSLCVSDPYQTSSVSTLSQQSFHTASLGSATFPASDLLFQCELCSSLLASSSIFFAFRPGSDVAYNPTIATGEPAYLSLPLPKPNLAASLKLLLQKQACSAHTGACSTSKVSSETSTETLYEHESSNISLRSIHLFKLGQILTRTSWHSV